MFSGKEKPLESKEFPDEADIESDEADEMVGLSRCGECGELIYEDTPRCPHCGCWVVEPGQQWRQSGKWYVRGGLFLARMVVVNWIVPLILAGVAAAVALWRLLR